MIIKSHSIARETKLTSINFTSLLWKVLLRGDLSRLKHWDWSYSDDLWVVFSCVSPSMSMESLWSPPKWDHGLQPEELYPVWYPTRTVMLGNRISLLGHTIPSQPFVKWIFTNFFLAQLGSLSGRDLLSLAHSRRSVESSLRLVRLVRYSLFLVFSCHQGDFISGCHTAQRLCRDFTVRWVVTQSSQGKIVHSVWDYGLHQWFTIF